MKKLTQQQSQQNDRVPYSYSFKFLFENFINLTSLRDGLLSSRISRTSISSSLII